LWLATSAFGGSSAAGQPQLIGAKSNRAEIGLHDAAARAVGAQQKALTAFWRAAVTALSEYTVADDRAVADRFGLSPATFRNSRPGWSRRVQHCRSGAGAQLIVFSGTSRRRIRLPNLDSQFQRHGEAISPTPLRFDPAALSGS